MTTTPNIAVLDVHPKFVLELAYGIRDPKELAEEYGYSLEEWEKLKAFEPFVKAVDARRAELSATGVTFRIKSAMMAEDLLPDIYSNAKAEGANFHTKLAAVTFLAKAAVSTPQEKTKKTSVHSSIFRLTSVEETSCR